MPPFIKVKVLHAFNLLTSFTHKLLYIIIIIIIIIITNLYSAFKSEDTEAIRSQ